MLAREFTASAADRRRAKKARVVEVHVDLFASMRDATPDGAGDVALITFSADAESLKFVCASAPPSAAHDE
ncbi:hypothetical protein D9619_006776 [Psilocybe cf. subviscida]|uniref:Uncharacterized protein n=1 Tax=Psilocybe cf. subviscida TaxID=2480587 RepID=A0A8H5EY63_9AGAR|nr:hypothetical protein D9619_006776 [Psilocybe cf. subviscida]